MRTLKRTTECVRLLETKLEIELPGAGILWHIAILVREGDTKLDHLQKINITPEGLILVIRRCAKRAYRITVERSALSTLRFAPLYHL